MPYAIRAQRVRCGGGERDVFVAAFSLAGGAVACLQLQDAGELRRGGVYLAESDDPSAPALAPRFDELFADAAGKLAEHPGLRGSLLDLLRRARDVARGCQPRLTPAALEEIGRLTAEARALEALAPPPPRAYSWEALLLCALLIFVSEEERYPRPRFRGGDLLLERFLQVLGPETR